MLSIQSDTDNSSDQILDNSLGGNVVLPVGDVQHSSDSRFLGKSSLLFDGDGDSLKINEGETGSLFLDGDYTIESWINLKSINEPISQLKSETQNSLKDGDILEITENTTLEYTSDRMLPLPKIQLHLQI